MQINLSSYRTLDHYFSLSLQPLSWDLLGTKNISSSAEKMWQKLHCVYPHKTIQTSSLGRQEKNSMEH